MEESREEAKQKRYWDWQSYLQTRTPDQLETIDILFWTGSFLIFAGIVALSVWLSK